MSNMICIYIYLSKWGHDSICKNKGSKDGKKAIQFQTVCINDEKNRETLREQPLPKIYREFMNYKKMRDFGQVPL